MKRSIVIMAALVILFFTGCGESIPEGAKIKNGIGTYTFYGPIASVYLSDVLEYYISHDVDRVVIEIQSPGGRVDELWRTIAVMEAYGDKLQYETRIFGMAASAGFLIFLAGDERLISRHAILLWHRVMVIGAGGRGWPMVGKEADFWNNKGNQYAASRILSMTQDQLEEKIKDGDWLIGAEKAIELGMAHGYIN